MANLRGINHLRKALKAPEDFFDNGSVLACRDAEEPTLLFVKTNDGAWAGLCMTTGESRIYDFPEVVTEVGAADVAQTVRVWKQIDLA